MKTFSAKNMLLAVMYDAKRVIDSGESSKIAYNILKKKLDEMSKIEDCDYLKIKWD